MNIQCWLDTVKFMKFVKNKQLVNNRCELLIKNVLYGNEL